ncbi:TilS substrate binding domain-containing protein [Rubritalea squalenifaciens DSM 18772]|uniref:tRNA(Ile)-lysidine synthase n=1 Tax=Rubritalea squalenifaciens DSM 18772 TaxID=1123071 RepID=A0A1M6QW12_9BACT|nr:tRNA lysidine(34) synthetase TilS [Rubritalea squalenifaciens]SHK24462.1 TilS substrate binding domain-containing protein [Rubritalea squalenifaciens DSM 18772]
MVEVLDSRWLERARDKRWLVAVSGGRDSVVLLDSLVREGVENLVVLHVNHSLRGEASDADEHFVADLADRYGLPFLLTKEDVGGIASSSGKGLELVAREVRLAAYVKGVTAYGCEGVALGHHADDQAETVLFKLLRGSDGFKGMKLENELYVDPIFLKVYRPMLGARRSTIDRYVQEYELEYREDETNNEPFTPRNRIRHEVMPLLSDVMGRDVVSAINNAWEACYQMDDFLDSQINFHQMLDPQGRLFLPLLEKQHEAVQGRVIHWFLKEKGVKDLSRGVVHSCVALCHVHGVAKVNLPGGGWMRRKEKRLFVEWGE